ncbi:hypothetical protein [uncultured Clostridium sp.]|uniref:hypothetical protein n=1 Tax=uncultured Clostridium sp. TaxID=59620 RepID=UPI0026F2CB37|nr:hypothetical protein [uncultured Clostridium sp.]
MAKEIVNVKVKDRLSLNEMEKKVRNARNSNDYILVKFGRKGEFIRVDFAKDQTYGVSHNMYNMEFMVKLSVMIRQYKVANIYKIADFVTNWVNRLNR